MPEFGDVEGLRRLYEAAVLRIRTTDIESAVRDAWLDELEWHYEQAITAGAACPGGCRTTDLLGDFTASRKFVGTFAVVHG